MPEGRGWSGSKYRQYTSYPAREVGRACVFGGNMLRYHALSPCIQCCNEQFSFTEQHVNEISVKSVCMGVRKLLQMTRFLRDINKKLILCFEAQSES